MQTPTEYQEQKMLIEWWKTAHQLYGIPEQCLFAFPNQGRRSMGTAMKMRNEGMRKGIPDLMLSVARLGFHGLFIEMKRISGSYASPEQKEFHELLKGQGFAVVVCHGGLDAIETVKGYLTLAADFSV